MSGSITVQTINIALNKNLPKSSNYVQHTGECFNVKMVNLGGSDGCTVDKNSKYLHIQ